MAQIFFLFLTVCLIVALINRNNELKHKINTNTNALSIHNLDKGGVFTLKNVGDDAKDMTLTVIAKHLYQQGDYSWYEYECDDGSDEKVWVDVDNDDKTVVTVVLEEHSLGDFNITPQILKECDENEKGAIQKYRYEDSGSANFYRYCNSMTKEKLYYWDFKQGIRMLSVERWGKSEYKVYISQIMKPHQIVILRNKG